MEPKVASLKLGPSPSDSASDPEEKEIDEGEDEDDDRNHKHRKRETRSQSLEGDSFDQVLTRSYRKRNKPFENEYSYDPQSGQTLKNYNISSERDFSSRFEKRRTNQTSFPRAPFDWNQRIRGNQMQSGEAVPVRGWRRETVSWGLHDSRNGFADVASQMVQPGPGPSGLFAGRGLPNMSNAQGTAWNAFGLVPGLPNGGVDALHPLGLQGALRPSISPSMNIGILRQRCRDFEERGFCLRGDMCPMEHGVNRIVIEDVQSLSQFNLPVSLPGSQHLGTSSGQGALPANSGSSSSIVNSKAFDAKSSKRGMTEEGLGLNGGVLGVYMAGGSDLYDPDQPLWTNDNPETSAALLECTQLNGETESFLDMDHSDRKNIGSNEGFDDEHPVRSAAATGSQSSSVWGRIGSSKNRLGLKERINSVGSSTSYLEQDIKSEETHSTGLQNVCHQGNGMSEDENVSQVKELSFKPHSDSIRNVRKPSHKAFRTLFVNGIPLKDNNSESLLSHFQKFGEVIDIYIPAHGERAFVQFSKREEAEAALKAPDAVMGNRFIKLWWANRDNIPDHGISGISNVPITPRGMTLHPAISHPFVPDRGKENPHPASGKDGDAHALVAQLPVYDDLKPMVAYGPHDLPLQQKKLDSLQLLKEELRKKQQMLDQKRNEFRRHLDKLEEQAAGSKVVTVSDHAAKRLKGETPFHAKAETFKSSPRANIITGSTSSAENSVTHTSTSNSTGAVLEPSSLRPSVRPQALLGTPFAVNRFKLDNRPTAFRIVSPLPTGLANVATLEELFSTYGDLSSVELEESELQETNDASVPPNVLALARISFKTRRSAEKAFLHGKSWQGHNLQFMWLTSKEGGASENPSASCNIPTDANVEPIREPASINSRKNSALGSGEPENMIRESDVESVSQDKDSKSSEKQLS